MEYIFLGREPKREREPLQVSGFRSAIVILFFAVPMEIARSLGGNIARRMVKNNRISTKWNASSPGEGFPGRSEVSMTSM